MNNFIAALWTASPTLRQPFAGARLKGGMASSGFRPPAVARFLLGIGQPAD
jgi:hypothetical protein